MLSQAMYTVKFALVVFAVTSEGTVNAHRDGNEQSSGRTTLSMDATVTSVVDERGEATLNMNATAIKGVQKHRNKHTSGLMNLVSQVATKVKDSLQSADALADGASEVSSAKESNEVHREQRRPPMSGIESAHASLIALLSSVSSKKVGMHASNFDFQRVQEATTFGTLQIGFLVFGLMLGTACIVLNCTSLGRGAKEKGVAKARKMKSGLLMHHTKRATETGYVSDGSAPRSDNDPLKKLREHADDGNSDSSNEAASSSQPATTRKTANLLEVPDKKRASRR